MFKLTNIEIKKFLRIPLAVAFGITLSACETDNSSILDLETLFPQDVIAQINTEDSGIGETDSGPGPDTGPDTGPDIGPDTGPDTGNGSGSEPETIINVNMPGPPVELSGNQIPVQLALLTEGEIVTTSRFNGIGEPIVDRFSLPASGYELSPDGEFSAIRTVVGDTITVCTYIFISAQYMCLRAFDLDVNDRVWHLFTMQSNANGTGVFEFCTVENSTDECLDKLIADPDGSATVAINRASALAQLPDASPYFSYENQAVFSNRSNDVEVSEHYVKAMNSLVAAASR